MAKRTFADSCGHLSECFLPRPRHQSGIYISWCSFLYPTLSTLSRTMSENNCKKILILGATGPTGILTVQAALERNHIVTIYARTPSKLPSTIFNHPNIKVT